jgi:NAD(P)-dependent dehydrogenase (short-subunit alcohol dehydrogenase family)
MRAVVITGTSTGIGEACVARLLTGGWTVFAGVRRTTDADTLKTRYDGDLRPVLLDVSDREQVQRAIDDIGRDVASSGLQGLVNNAGVGVGGPVEYVTEDDWRWVFDVNLFGVVALTRAAMPLLRQGNGRIVHIGSIGGRISSPGLAPYSASKHALAALAEAQRHEFARSGTPMAVSLVEPGEVKTAIWDKGDAQVDQVEGELDEVGRDRYGWLLDQSRGFLAEGRKRGISADKVAQVVEHALTADRPKPRYLVGPDAKLFGHVVARAPDRLRDALVRFGSKRWERQGRKLRA